MMTQRRDGDPPASWRPAVCPGDAAGHGAEVVVPGVRDDRRNRWFGPSGAIPVQTSAWDREVGPRFRRVAAGTVVLVAVLSRNGMAVSIRNHRETRHQ